ncbi:MAG: RNA-binding protein [Verrucomicrobia bacterium]|nr:RNA-binding protein [Verrucomicrobiota bacterium]
MNNKLYVGSLPYSTSEQELQELFAQFGEITSVRIIMDKFTGQSKGFGFVEMANADEAQNAIAQLNGTEFGGRTLVVNVARPPQERERGGGGRERGGRDREHRHSRHHG